MYYNNKTTFYVRQYGPVVLIVLLSVLFIGSGVLIYLNNSALNKAPSETIVASNNLENTVNEKGQSTVKQDTSLLPAEFESLDVLEKSSKIELIEITSSNQLVVSAKSKRFSVELIGVDLSKTSQEVMDSIYQELINANLELAFDKTKYTKKVAYAYIYKDGTLYNEKLLEEGKATLKSEKTNNSLNDTLAAAQAYAKQTRSGIWSNANEY